MCGLKALPPELRCLRCELFAKAQLGDGPSTPQTLAQLQDVEAARLQPHDDGPRQRHALAITMALATIR